MRGGKNQEVLHQFIEGLKGDFDEHAESPKSYQNGVNGRLFSHNGVLSYSSIKGTKEVYNNPNIVKYLGFWPFEDELIIFVKCIPEDGDTGGGDGTDEVVETLISDSFTANIPFNSNSVDITTLIDDNTVLDSYTVVIPPDPVDDPFDFEDVISCVSSTEDEIDLTEYFTEIYDDSGFQVCSVDGADQTYENNSEYSDCIISLKKDSSGNIFSTTVWTGFLNWPMDGKIITYGIFENNFFKRVYFTDYVNPFRVLNLKDPNISNRAANEFTTFQSSALLQPIIETIDNAGQIKASSVVYTYRLKTTNGQSTEFSPFSFAVKITAEEGDQTYAGGDISQTTNKHVLVKCNVIGWENFEEIECVAVEYEASGAPTSIRNLGTKAVNAVVFFDHFGNEAEFSDDIDLNTLLQRRNTWRYCSDLSSKGNRLLASGLRNDPIPNNLLTVDRDFALHSWDETGETHLCLLNPDPCKYRYIDPLNDNSFFFVKQKVYNSIQVFGSFTIELTNTLTGEFMSQSYVLSALNYVDMTIEIYNWLDSIKSTTEFQTKFPNVDVNLVNGKIHFFPIDDSIQTDFSKIIFNYNTTQVIEDVSEDIEFADLTVATGNLVYGAQSLGFNQGNGIRLTFKTESEVVSEQATGVFPTSTPIVNIKEPSLKKGFFKGEIYRIGLQLYDVDGYQLFTIPLGDIKIPEIGEEQRSIDDNGNPIFGPNNYRNSFEDGSELKAERIVIKADVRLSCEVQRLVSMYQLVYVERTEENRSILCQGISAPMERCNIYYHSEHISLRPEVANKWNLPYYGGPTYDGNGLVRYDIDPHDENQWDWDKRIVTHRGLFYFDSPDVIYNKISGENIANGTVNRIARLNTDHTPTAIRQSSGEIYPKHSRKIYSAQLDGGDQQRPYYVNVSVFAKETEGINDFLDIDKAEKLAKGQIITGTALNAVQDVSNNAMTLARQAWFYSGYARNSDRCGVDNGARSELFNSNNISPGYSTVVIKTTEDCFTNEFINQAPFYVDSEVRDPYGYDGPTYDTHGLINIKMNNESSIYGGRSELAYSQNTYVPLSQTIPVLGSSNAIQSFCVNGDTYTTLYVRLKNDFTSPYEPRFHDMNNSGGCQNKDEEEDYSRYGAWAYAFVVETSLQPRWTDKERFYREANPFNFSLERTEAINEAYFQENTLRSYIPKPFKFKDDPNLGNIIAASETKLNGDTQDAWTDFRTNNFYEVEKDKGTVFNLAKQENEVYAVQERQTSLLVIDSKTFIPTESGDNIAVQQGDGSPISDHRIISDFGTSIRRAIVENRFGFTFIDEHQYEFIKIKKPLLVNNSLFLKFRDLFEQNDIIDTEGYYDDEYKETNIRIRTKDGISYMLSYNEALQVFNGWIEYDNDIYMDWNGFIYSPKLATTVDEGETEPRPDASSLHQLNEGPFLNFFDDQKTMKLGVICNMAPNTVKIFKHWAGIISIDYNIKQIDINTNLGDTRTILGDHHRYKIREGRHSVPLKNRTDFSDLRGEWMYIEVEIESLNNAKVDIFSFINFVRHSYQ